MATAFTNSCAIIDYPCPNGKTYINPCDCNSYLQCSNGFTIITRPCATGTTWDHVIENCLGTNQVVIEDKRCNLNVPWNRCRNVNDNQGMSTLRKMCTQSGDNSGGNGNENNGNGSDESGGGSNAGAIAGGVIGGLLVLVIIGIIIYVVAKKKSLPKLFRSVSKSGRNTYKANTHDHQAEPDEEIYEVIDEKQVRTPVPVDNPGYEKQSKQHSVMYNNLADANRQNPNSSGTGVTNNNIMEYSSLKPDTYNDIGRSYSTLRASQEEDLSRSISINGTDVPVQDTQGYFIGYPSGTVPRQSSPIPQEAENEVDDGYSLGKAPGPDDVETQSISGLPSDCFVLQSDDEANNKESRNTEF